MAALNRSLNRGPACLPRVLPSRVQYLCQTATGLIFNFDDCICDYAIMDLRRRPSVTSRLSFAVSNAERGESLDLPAVAADQQIEEEIAEIKRYEVPSLPTPWPAPVSC